jgi:hypothetical protein
MAVALRFCDQKAAEEHLMKQPRDAMKCLLVTLENPSPKAMITGLKVLAGLSKHVALRYMRRAPTYEELAAANVKGADEVWRRMPWEFMQPVTAVGEGKVRGLLLKHIDDNPQLYAQVFVNTDHRMKAYTAESIELRDQCLADWRGYQERITERYYAACAVRAAFEAAGTPLEVQQVIMIGCLSSNPDLLEHMSDAIDDRIYKALEGYRTPLVKGYGGALREEDGSKR